MNKCRFEMSEECNNEKCIAYNYKCPVSGIGYSICKYAEEQKVHELKILPNSFEDVKNYITNFVVTENDKDFNVGDRILLREWDGEYKKRELYREIICILNDNIHGVEKGYCILGLKI